MSKRDYGEGSYKISYEDEAKTKIKSYHLYVRYGKDEKGKDIRKCFTGKTKKECKKKKEEYESQIEAISKKMIGKRLSNELDNWLLTKNVNMVRPQTHARNLNTAKMIKRKIGDKRVSEITPKVIQEELINELQEEGVSVSSIKKCYFLLSQFFRFKENEGQIEKNPMRKGVVALPSEKYNKKQIRALSDYEKEKILEAAKKKYKNGSFVYKDIYDYIVLALNTGLRQGEELALKTDAVNLENGTITVKRNLSEYNIHGKTIVQVNDYVKRASSFRTIPINDKAREVLERRMQGEYIFQSRTGSPVVRTSIDRTLNKIKKALTEETGYDFTFLTSHVFRHTFACDLYKNQVDLARIQKLLGHESLQITVDIYINLFSSIDPKIDNMLVNAVNSL